MTTATKPIQIFKPGRHTASNGAALAFSEADLQATAAAYDPAKHEAPLVVGHPKHDAPAYGWVKGLAFGEGLEATPDQVDPAFAELVANGSFKKISASFYAPDSPSNPVPGVYYLRHVGFLGAQPPAVKGLRNPEFAASEEGIVEFADWSDVQNASLWRRLREWIISFRGLDEADKILPDYAIASLEDAARQETSADTPALLGTAFTELNQGDDMSAEDQLRLTALETENATLKTERQAALDREAASTRAAGHTAHAAFTETLIHAGKLLPAHQDFIVAFMDHVAADGGVIEFGEGAAKKSQPGIDGFQAYLTAQPKIVDFKERAGGDLQDDKPEDASTIAVEALAYKEAQAKAGSVINIAQAVMAVQARKAAAAT